MIDIKKLTLKQKIGQMIGLAFSGSEYSPELQMQIEDIEAGLIIYFKDNCISPKQIFDLNKKIDTLFDAITANNEKHELFEKSIISFVSICFWP